MSKADGNDKGGRPTKYQAEFARQANILCLLGATNQQLADFFEVNTDTVHEWAKKHKGFSDALKGGKIYADATVAQALYKRATGYNYHETTFEKIDLPEKLQGAEIKTDAYKKKVVSKHLPPDAGAALNWLKNRQRDLWKDKHDIADLTDEQLDKIINRLQQNVAPNDKAKED